MASVFNGIRRLGKSLLQAGEYIHFYFDTDSRIFDPENYELTLAQQNIVPGSHLRLLLQPDPGSSDRYRASFIWIGD